MRKEFVEAKTHKAAVKLCPWASAIQKVEDGYMCFENVQEWLVWIEQI